MSLEKVIVECGFSLRPEPAKVVLVASLTGKERDLTAPEANMWADVCRRLLPPRDILEVIRACKKPATHRFREGMKEPEPLRLPYTDLCGYERVFYSRGKFILLCEGCCVKLGLFW